MKRFRGGLDIKNDNTGYYSIYEKYQTAEIMFHVSKLFPHSVKDEQHLERKRHIGETYFILILCKNSLKIYAKNIFLHPQNLLISNISFIKQQFLIKSELKNFEIISNQSIHNNKLSSFYQILGLIINLSVKFFCFY
jgi:hypothetical protein